MDCNLTQFKSSPGLDVIACQWMNLEGPREVLQSTRYLIERRCQDSLLPLRSVTVAVILETSHDIKENLVQFEPSCLCSEHVIT